jgi:hypothetical protein
MKIDAEGGHNVDAGAITEDHHKPEPRPLDGAGVGLSHRETDLRSRIESILIEIALKSNDHVLRPAPRANLSGIGVIESCESRA